MNRRLFIAEDDMNLLEVYKTIFSSDNIKEECYKIEARFFDNGEDLQINFNDYFNHNKPIPLCILDVRLPGKDGFKIAKEIRKIDSRVMIIFVTGYTDKSPQELRDLLSYDYYFIRKPFMEEEILSLVDSLLKRWNQTLELEQKNKEITDKSKALSLSKQKFQHLTENLQKEYFFYTHDREGKYLFITPSVEKILGYSEKEFQQKRHEIMTNNPRNKLANMYTKLSLDGKQQPSYEVELIHKNGSIITMEIAEFPLENEAGKVIAIEGMAHDITRAKKERITSKQQNQFLGKVIDSLSHPFYVINPKNYNLILSNSAARSKKSTSITTCYKLRYGKDTPCNKLNMPCPIDELKKTGKPVKLEHCIDDPIEGLKYYDVYAYPIIDEKGELSQVIEYSLDVTDQKNMNKELFEAKNQAELINELVPSSLFTIDTDCKITSWNNKIEEVTGYNADEVIGKKCILFAETPCRDGCKLFDDDVKKPITGVECTIRRKDGKLRIISKNSDVITDDTGKIIGGIESFEDITDRKKAEEEIQKSTEKYKNMFELSPEAIVLTDKDGIIIDINRRINDWLGYDTELMIGKHILELPIFKTESKKFIVEKFRDSIKQDNRKPYEVEFVAKNGEIKIGLIFSTKMKDAEGNRTGDLILVHDITESKKEESLRTAVYDISSAVNKMTNLKDLSEFIREALGTVIDTSNFYIALYDKDKDLITLPYQKDEKDKIICFPAAKTMTGYIIKNNQSLLANEEVQKILHTEEKIDLVGAPSKIWLGVPLKIRDNVIGAVVVQSYNNPDLYNEQDQEILEFVSGQIAVALERKRYELSLKEAKDIAEDAAKAKADFLASMSHEIRTPMNGVIGMTSLLMDTQLSSEQKEYVETIRISGDSLLTIINDILDFSKIESGKMELENQPLNVVTTIEETFDLIATKASEKNLDLVYLIEPEVPAMIKGDVTRLRQILVNLVNNAVKFTPAGDILITVSRNDLKNDKIELEFAVKDTGIGIPKMRLKRLFKAFSQVDSSTTRKYGGTGLGLAICKNLVKMMNGRIWVESEEGNGSTFFFTIRTTIAPVKRKKFMVDLAKKLKGARVLIVDDNQTNRKILTLQCKNKGMLPYSAASAEEALELINEGERFDIGILDMHMPEVNGAQLGKKIRERFSLTALPLIMLSSVGKPDQIDNENEIFNAFLPKPVKQRQLFELISDILGHGNQESEKSVRGEQHKLLDPKIAKKIPIKILLAEDNIINQKIAKRILEKMGYNIDIAANGLEVLDAVERQKYDLIFMDVQMPEMDGLEATKRLNELYHKDIRPKIVAMTANAMEGDKERCLAAGMDDYVSKPIIIGEIINILEKWGKKSRHTEDGKLDRNSSDDIMDWKMIDSIKNLDVGDDIGNLLIELITQLYSDLPTSISEIKTAVESKDHEKMKASAHKLKGSSANLGAKGIAKVAYKFEVKGKEANFDDTEVLFEKMGKVIKDTREEYLKYFAEFNKGTDLP